jgi:hypothetical protein
LPGRKRGQNPLYLLSFHRGIGILPSMLVPVPSSFGGPTVQCVPAAAPFFSQSPWPYPAGSIGTDDEREKTSISISSRTTWKQKYKSTGGSLPLVRIGPLHEVSYCSANSNRAPAPVTGTAIRVTVVLPNTLTALQIPSTLGSLSSLGV